MSFSERGLKDKGAGFGMGLMIWCSFRQGRSGDDVDGGGESADCGAAVGADSATVAEERV